MQRLIIGWIGLTMLLTAGENAKVVDLAGAWKFKTGDDKAYMQTSYDDSDWDRIHVPDKWENQGHSEYDGFAWYRRSFDLPIELADTDLLINLGKIDDVDLVYINGEPLQGRGTFPPKYQSAFSQERKYLLPGRLLRFGEKNRIAVRVYDAHGAGGIVSGNIGIYTTRIIRLAMDLSGLWGFKVNDDERYSDPDYCTADWQRIRVPAHWDAQNYNILEGYAWYRITTRIPSRLNKGRLVLVLGRIDDADEVFFNGVRIALTGQFPQSGARHSGGPNWWEMERFYYIPMHIIRWDDTNTIAVRVYNWNGPGGIYEGPVGIATQDALIHYKTEDKPDHDAGF